MFKEDEDVDCVRLSLENSVRLSIHEQKLLLSVAVEMLSSVSSNMARGEVPNGSRLSF